MRSRNLFGFRVQLQTLYKYIEQKGSLQELAPLLATLTKQKTAVTQLAKQGLKDLEELILLLRRLGVKLRVILCQTNRRSFCRLPSQRRCFPLSRWWLI